MHIVDVADELVRELEPYDDKTISIPFVAYWLRANIATLNNYLKICFSVQPTTLELVDASGNLLKNDEIAVYKSVFRIYYYERKQRYYLGAAGMGEAIQISSDGGMVRLISKLDIGKQFNQLKKDEVATLKDLINAYKRSHYCPQSVDSDEVDPLITHPIAPYYRNQLGPTA